MLTLLKSFLFRRHSLNVPDLPPDERDWTVPPRPESEDISKLKSFTLRGSTVPVKSQGSIGSCVGHSGRVTYGFFPVFKKEEPSPMWIYKKGKFHDAFPGEEYSGTTIRGACKALQKEGCCFESFWPYVSKEDTAPKEGAPEDAATKKIKAYYVIPAPSTFQIKEQIMKGPLWASFRVHRHIYYTPKTGVIDTKKYLASDVVGGHAVSLVGWKEIEGKLYWEFQNSWGWWFGDDGFFFMEDSLYRKIILNAVGPYFLEAEHSIPPTTAAPTTTPPPPVTTTTTTTKAPTTKAPTTAAPKTTPPPPDPQKKKKWPVWAGVGIGVAVLIFLLIKFFGSSYAPEDLLEKIERDYPSMKTPKK